MYDFIKRSILDLWTNISSIVRERIEYAGVSHEALVHMMF